MGSTQFGNFHVSGDAGRSLYDGREWLLIINGFILGAHRISAGILRSQYAMYGYF